MGRAAGPVFGGPRGSGSSLGVIRAQINERAGGPVAHGSVVCWGLAPASYLVVGTPLPRTRPETGAIVGA